MDIEKTEQGKLKITRKSNLTGIVHTRIIENVSIEQILEWQRGKLIQYAMPNASLEDREFLISGITPEEWDKHFA